MRKSKLIKAIGLGLLSVGSITTLASCSIEKLFVLGGGLDFDASGLETFDGTENALFFALYNYYGYEGQHFTNKWLGMNDALKAHGITVTGYEGNKDAKTFKIKREANCDLPEDAVIYMVNNQNWDPGIQYKTPFAKYKPMAVISTCNGVEFAADPIKSSGMHISNATMAGFSDVYKDAFEQGTLTYLSAKYAAHILPIIKACVDAVDNGSAMRNADGTALSLSIENWAIQTLAEYEKMEKVDSIDKEHPTLRNVNIDQFFDKSNPNYGAENLSKWVSDSSKENITALYELNGTNEASDTVRQGRRLKCGILAPSSVNDQVQKYIDYINGYCSYIYNLEIVTYPVTSSNTQDIGATALCSQKCDFIISLQDDTNRNKSIQNANKAGVYYGIAGTTQNPIDYELVKNLPYYVGSIGTSIDEERRAAREMTEYYLQCMIHRAKGDLAQWQTEYKGLTSEKED